VVSVVGGDERVFGMSSSTDDIRNKPFVFVTGPYSAPTKAGIEANIRKSIEIGRRLFQKGYYPIVPHLLVKEYYQSETNSAIFGYEPLMKYTMAIAQKCDVLLLYESSPGADRERRLAESLGIPVYFDVDDLPDLCDD
jgi:hypothetical protein